MMRRPIKLQPTNEHFEYWNGVGLHLSDNSGNLFIHEATRRCTKSMKMLRVKWFLQIHYLMQRWQTRERIRLKTVYFEICWAGKNTVNSGSSCLAYVIFIPVVCVKMLWELQATVRHCCWWWTCQCLSEEFTASVASVYLDFSVRKSFVRLVEECTAGFQRWPIPRRRPSTDRQTLQALKKNPWLQLSVFCYSFSSGKSSTVSKQLDFITQKVIKKVRQRASMSSWC